MANETKGKPGILARLSDADCDELLKHGQIVPFRDGSKLLGQGEVNESLFIVLEGLLHVRRHAEGRDVLLGRLEPGGFFGDISLFDPGPTTAAVVSVSNGRVVKLGREELQRFASGHPSAAFQLVLGLLEGFAARLRRTDERLVEAIFWGGLLK